ncbi:unnamed protein product [Macrosiphum euphorbiae]|uniref:Uncharacterized protein n=1 Tax=Macrosiphum euphorbiae TaxID=13131 RepID=A0AAV0XEG2_9HEMI|nr:unnamed protein product [Macrosiphum euphorbiae]
MSLTIDMSCLFDKNVECGHKFVTGRVFVFATLNRNSEDVRLAQHSSTRLNADSSHLQHAQHDHLCRISY